MNFAKVYSAQTTFLAGKIIHVEVDISLKTLQAFTIVGLPDKAVEESRDRVSAAIKNSGFKSPKNKNEKTVVSLAPADLKKEGPLFDLSIALSYLLASGDIVFNPAGKVFLGELSLDGELRPIKGVLALTLEAKRRGFKEIYVPEENAKEAALINDITIFGAHTLRDVISHLRIERLLRMQKLRNSQNTSKETEGSDAPLQQSPLTPQIKTKITYKKPENTIDFGDIKGQDSAKRGLEIAASGGHNIAMYGPPGTGKTMLARAFCHILPPLSFDESIETTAIHSIAGHLKNPLVTHPPFRSPHHTSSYVSVIGGGTFPKPGEATLAHNGVLFLDEFPEFDRRVIESLRQPLEERTINISRAKGTAQFPANFIFVAAMNPCPCGNYGSKKECLCMPAALARYQLKMSGPIMDRIDMWIEVTNIEHEKLSEKRDENETDIIKQKVLRSRKIQKERFKKARKNITKNSDMGSRELTQYVLLEEETRKELNNAATRLGLSPRAYHRVIKLARTIADLDESKNVKMSHILEAIQYRPQQK